MQLWSLLLFFFHSRVVHSCDFGAPSKVYVSDKVILVILARLSFMSLNKFVLRIVQIILLLTVVIKTTFASCFTVLGRSLLPELKNHLSQKFIDRWFGANV